MLKIMASLISICNFLLFFILIHGSFQVDDLMVNTSQGKLLGLKLYTTETKRPYFAFGNIPYTKPPIGNLRFKPPQNAPSWKGIRQIKITPICNQWYRNFDTSNFYGQEDCLYINVFTPVIPLNEKAKLPVLVCIHGGDFQRGSSYECPANNFMDKDVIFVSFNYRLGVFGFISAADRILPGNNGLKDQVAALKWVKNNIKTFGGDPDRVTIFGSGSGGASVHYHLHSPLSKGLFHSAISQSGSALIPWAFTMPNIARQRTLTLANYIKCPNDTTGDVFMCLSKTPSKIIIELQPKLSTWNSEPNVVFTPTIEPETADNPFLLKNPWTESEENLVPWIVGINAGEGVLKSSVYFGDNEALLQRFNNETDLALPVIITYSLTAKSSDIPIITEKIKTFYFNNEPVTAHNAQKLIDLFTDSMVAYGTMKAASRYPGPKYFYLFDHVNKQTFSDSVALLKGYEKYKQPSHGDESVSLLYVPWSYVNKESIENDLSVSRKMINYWTNFAESGNPNGRDKVVWQPLKSDKFEYLRISSKNTGMESELFSERYKFWDSLPIVSKMANMRTTFSVTTTRDEL